MTRLLIGLTGGLYTFDLVANCGPGPVLPGVQPMAFAMDPSEHGRVYCASYNRGLWRSEDAGETWLPVGTPQGFFEGPADGAIEPRETTFVSVDPVAQADGQYAVWVGTEPSRLYGSTDHGDTFELVSALDLPSRSSWSLSSTAADSPCPVHHPHQRRLHASGYRGRRHDSLLR
jgi:hypothetical protein